jgi:hypothetical protein
MKVGVWTTALGAKVTKTANLIIGPAMPCKDAWDQGAYAWTPEQRLAWAINTTVKGTSTYSAPTVSVPCGQAGRYELLCYFKS